jgi:hypothetical protein
MFQVRAIAAALALLLLAYVAAYLTLSDPNVSGVSLGAGSTTWVSPHYRVGAETAEAVFRPLELLDRRARPTFWATRHESSVRPVYAPTDDPAPE